jgi:hypothetical protein
MNNEYKASRSEEIKMVFIKMKKEGEKTLKLN